jgi:heat shock protein HspQ
MGMLWPRDQKNAIFALNAGRCAALDCRARGHRLFPAGSILPGGQKDTRRIIRKAGDSAMMTTQAKYHIGQVLRHRKHPFRGVVFDVDAMFSNTDEWYAAIPEESRPSKDQPFYHLLAENDQSYYVAYVSEQNLVPDETGEPVSHPDLPDLFGDFEDGRYPLQFQLN